MSEKIEKYYGISELVTNPARPYQVRLQYLVKSKVSVNSKMSPLLEQNLHGRSDSMGRDRGKQT